MRTLTYVPPPTATKIGAPTLRIEIDPPRTVDDMFLDTSPWQVDPDLFKFGIDAGADEIVIGLDPASTYTIKWTVDDHNNWEANNVNIYGGTLQPDGGSGDSGGEYITGEGHLSTVVGNGVYGAVSTHELGWIGKAYDSVKQRLRR